MLRRHEALFNQLKEYRGYTIHIIEGLTEEQADLVPDGFSNNIRWNLGHIVLDQYLWIKHLTKEPIDIPEGYTEWFNFGTSPSTWQTNPPSLAELKRCLSQQIDYIHEKYGDRLEEEFPETESGMHTIAQVLVRTIFHEGLHIAVIQDIKRFV